MKLFDYQHPSDELLHPFSRPLFQPSQLLFLGGVQNGAYFHNGLVGVMVTAVLWSTHWLGIIDVLSQAGSGHERRHSSPQWTQCVSRGLQTWIGPLKVYHCDTSACNQCKQDERALSKETNTDMSSVWTKKVRGFLAKVHAFVYPIGWCVHTVYVCAFIHIFSSWAHVICSLFSDIIMYFIMPVNSHWAAKPVQCTSRKQEWKYSLQIVFYSLTEYG